MGFHRAGFEVVGVDNRPQPRYPFRFVLADWLGALMALYRYFDLIVAGPPCQRYSRATNATGNALSHPNLVAPVREALISTGKPYIIENVVGAPLLNPIMLCGSMFGLRVYRHRLFECNPVIWWPPATCNHWAAPGRKPGTHIRSASGIRILQSFENSDVLTVTGKGYNVADGKEAMGIDWMNGVELSQAIPPDYTEWLGQQMLERI